MRVTRAAQRAQQDVEEHIEAPEVNERALKDIEPNTPPVTQNDEPLPAKTPAKTPAKKAKGKAGKRGAKGKKAKTEEEEAQDGGEVEAQAIENGVNESPEQEPARDHTEDVDEGPNNNEQPNVPQAPAARLTRRQLAKLEEDEALGESQRAPISPEQSVNTDAQATENVDTDVQHDVDTALVIEIPAVQEGSTVEPTPAPKPTRRTRRQQTKPEEEEDLADEVADNITVNAAEEPEALDDTGNTTEQYSSVSANETSKPLEPEVSAKSKRLTRRQQAKLEEEQQTSRNETSQELVEEVATDAQMEAVGEQETVEQAESEVRDIPMVGAPMPTVGEYPNKAQELDTDPRQVMEEVEPASIEEHKIVEDQVSPATEGDNDLDEMVEARPATPLDAEFEADLGTQSDDEIMPSVEITTEAEPKMLCEEKPFETSASTPAKSQNSIRRMSRSPTKSPMRIEESISAIDRLEEDLESIGTAIPDLEQSDDEKSPQKFSSTISSTAKKGKTPSKTPAKTPVPAPARTPAKSASKTSSRTPAKAPIVTKALPASKLPPTAKALPPTAKALPPTAKALLPTKISRVPSNAPKSVKPTTTSLARASSVRAAPSKEVSKPSTETADYLASKRRPISLSFPTPPPPPKGRAPTKPTFQLSSENVAAKLRAQKEERLKREAEGVAAPKQRPISMPPPPKSTKAPTVPSFQLPGEATAARLKAQKEERLKRMEEAGGAEKPTIRPISMPPPPKSTKPPTKPSFQLPGEATAARLKAQKEERLKRMEEAEAARKAAPATAVRKAIVHRPRQSLLVKDAPGVSIPPPPQSQSDTLQRSTSLASKRSSLAGASRSTSTSSANRHSVLLAEGRKSTVTPLDAAALKNKGRQVFNRDKMEKEAVERERREKEDAAKKARAEAAERGRIASREWAERQRKKMMGQ